MKTWEIMKRIDEKGIECVGETYKLTKVNDGVRVGEVGMVVEIGKFRSFIALTDLKGHRVDWIVGQEEWVKIEERYYLQDKFIAQTNPDISYLNLDELSNEFFLSDRDEYSLFKIQFTKADIAKFQIPLSKYGQIEVENDGR